MDMELEEQLFHSSHGNLHLSKLRALLEDSTVMHMQLLDLTQASLQ
jgi:hypothetical protein